MAIPINIRMSLEEFIEQFDEAPFELIDGEKIAINLPVFGVSSIKNQICYKISEYSNLHQLGEAYINAVFVELNDHQWITRSRVPDVAFFRGENMDAYKQANPDWAEKPLMLLPDLVVEIVSPTDRYSEVNKKVNKYLEDGVSTIWVIDATQQTAIIYTAGSNQQTRLTSEEMLTGGEVLPGFEVKLAELFK